MNTRLRIAALAALSACVAPAVTALGKTRPQRGHTLVPTVWR